MAREQDRDASCHPPCDPPHLQAPRALVNTTVGLTDTDLAEGK